MLALPDATVRIFDAVSILIYLVCQLASGLAPNRVER